MRNTAASVRHRLLNLSREQQRPFQEVLQFYVMERFLYRLAKSPHADRFILKGALMLQVWDAPQARPTMDIDMLGRISNDHDSLAGNIHDILATPVEEDGLVFDVDSLTLQTITEDADYRGVRIRFFTFLENARARLQLDLGFGDVVEPEPKRLTYPVVLDFPAPVLLCYSRETTIAEKFEAMVSLGALNSRMKDFYDIWLLCRQFPFQLNPLRKAVETTFLQRGTTLPKPPMFSSDFITDKQPQWQAFINRVDQDDTAQEFSAIIALLETFLGETVESSATTGNSTWSPGGPWQQGNGK